MFQLCSNRVDPMLKSHIKMKQTCIKPQTYLFKCKLPIFYKKSKSEKKS